MKIYPELKTMDWYHNLILERNEDGSITEEQFDAYLERYKHIFINDKIFSDYMYPFCWNFRLSNLNGGYMCSTNILLGDKEVEEYERLHPLPKRPKRKSNALGSIVAILLMALPIFF